MFSRLMAIMERGGAVTVDQVAHELNTTPAVVAGMLEHMAHTGWVRDLAISCDQRCTECVFVRDCTHFKRGRVWQVNG